MYACQMTVSMLTTAMSPSRTTQTRRPRSPHGYSGLFSQRCGHHLSDGGVCDVLHAGSAAGEEEKAATHWEDQVLTGLTC